VSAPATDRERAENEGREGNFGRILLASEGRPIPDAAIDRVAELAGEGASVHVFAIARVHGVAFGLPNPGLMPTKAEWAEQRRIVDNAIWRLERRGLKAEGSVLGTRKSTARICDEARKEECEAIVMAADADRNPLIGGMLWEQEPQRVRRKARIPVFLVREPA